jgi:Ala-tRNA(Pro) deacylase
MPINKIKEYLDKHQVKYVSLAHSPAFTSQEIAASAHVSGKVLAKTVMVKADGLLAMVVIPANSHVNFAKLRELMGAKELDLASESEFKEKFAGCEVGAMPPFGPLYGMTVYLSDQIHGENIIFNAGTHSELMQLALADYQRLAEPKVVAI